MHLLCTFGYGTVPTRCCHLTHTQPGIGFSVAQHSRAHRIGQSTLAPPALALRSAVHGQRRATRQIARALQSVKESTFEQDVLQADKTVLVDFWAPWCGPCRLIEPLLTQISQELDGELKIVKADADSSPSLVEKYKVYGLPTLMLFRDGKKVDASHREGAITKPKLLQYLEQHGIAAPAVK